MDSQSPDEPSNGEELSAAAMRAIARAHGLDFVDLLEVSIPPSVAQSVPKSVARENSIFPLGEDAGVLKVAICDPLAFGILEVLDKLRFVLNRQQVTIALATRDSINTAIDRYFGKN